MNDFGYYKSVIENLEKVNAKQEENIKKAASLMADAIADDRLISVYGGGGHTTLPVGEMFFRAFPILLMRCMKTTYPDRMYPSRF